MRLAIAFWVLTRFLCSMMAAIFSTLSPLNLLEKQIKIWPPSHPIHLWLERFFLTPWLRWDAHWYVQILQYGYRSDNGTTQFHPLYIWLAEPLSWIGFSPLLSLILISLTSGILFTWFFYQLAILDLTKEDAQSAVILMLAFPLAIVLSAPYTEATFLMLSAASLFAARKYAWQWAGITAGLATLTRQQGLFLFLPILIELWQANLKTTMDGKRFPWTAWLSMIWIGVGEGVWLGLRWRIGDLHVSFESFNHFIYSLFISPSANQVVPIQSFLPPWEVLYKLFTKLRISPDVDSWINLFGILIYIGLLILSWSKLRLSYRLFSLIIIMIGLSYYTGPVHPYCGFLRHCYLAFPIFIGVAPFFKQFWQRLLYVGWGIFSMLFLLLMYELESWVL